MSDDPIETWRTLLAEASKAWVLFAHGTCVVLPEPEVDPSAQAVRLLREWGPVHPGSSTGDVSVIEPASVPGFVVTCHHTDILTYVGPDEADADAGEIAIGLIGRNKRDCDAAELRVVHVEA